MSQTITEATQAEVAALRAGANKKRVAGKQTNRLEVLKPVYVPLNTVSPNTYNPNQHEEEDFIRLCHSIAKRGMTDPIVVNEDDNTIVDGEHRWHACDVLGFEEIPVAYVSMTAVQRKISTLRHNTTVGTHDEERETAIFRDLQRLGALDDVQSRLVISDDELERRLGNMSALDLAGDSFSNAWIPVKAHENDVDAIKTGEADTVGELNVDSKNNPTVTALSAGAIEEQKKQYEAIEAADDPVDQYAQTRKSPGIKLMVSFKSEDGLAVQEVLGDEPAMKLLEFCKRYATEEEIDIA